VQAHNHTADRVRLDGFYRSKDASSLMMRLANFPDEMLPLLQLEMLAALSALQCYTCESVVEFGCYDGRALEVTRLADVGYVGVDLDESGIETLRKRIASERLEGRASAVVADVLEPEEWLPMIPAGRSLVHLPFNFIGGFRDVPQLLRSVCRVPDMLLLITVFNTDDYTTSLRRRYYTACGVGSLAYTHEAQSGVLFTGSMEFFSRALTPEALGSHLAECGLQVLWRKTNRIGTCILARPTYSPGDR
jgi:hypothetical protein